MLFFFIAFRLWCRWFLFEIKKLSRSINTLAQFIFSKTKNLNTDYKYTCHIYHSDLDVSLTCPAAIVTMFFNHVYIFRYKIHISQCFYNRMSFKKEAFSPSIISNIWHCFFYIRISHYIQDKLKESVLLCFINK